MREFERQMLYALRRYAIDTSWGQDWDEWMAARPDYGSVGHQLGYDPTIHNEGKGLITSDGAVWTWPTYQMRPQHLEYNMKARRQGLGTRTPFHITNGQVYVYGPGRTLSPQDQQAIMQADPRLTPANAQATQQAVQQAPTGFGHGRNVLDILDRSG